ASSAIIAFIPIFIVSLVKLLIPIKRIRHLSTAAEQLSASLWVSFAILITKLNSPKKFEIEQNAKHDSQGSYLIICNHKSW
ncbi:acyltransferase, partial [Francisella tularensis subsp. holarctica]|nr:acyltransferase [Francisella tularensis subsp. holarctica]